MSIKSSRHGGDVFGLSEEEQDKVFDFSININPLGLSSKGRAALLAHWEKETLRYPDVECRALKKSLSIRYGIPEESMALGKGTTENELLTLHECMLSEIKKLGGSIDKVYYSKGIDDTDKTRKPNTNTLLILT